MRKIPILRRLTAPLNRLQPQPILRRFATRCHCVNDPQKPPVIKLQKKALIIGIQYAGTRGKLTNTHRDAKLWKDLLIRKYGFDAKNIVMMLDDGNDPWFSPTKNNILREIANFVDDVNAGDELVFYYSGHTDQVATEDVNEEDGLNEVLVPVDYFDPVGSGNTEKFIVDNDLRELLVDRLPIGSKLTAVFDSCHSGTLLDLDHYLCNEVYHPFLCRAPSKQKSKWMGIGELLARSCFHAQWTVEGQCPPRPAVEGRAASIEGTRIHQRLRESSEKVSCIDTALTQLQDSADRQRRFQVETRGHASIHTPSRANSASSPPERADTTDSKPARTDTQETEPARRTSVQTRRTSVQIRQTSGQSERMKTRRAAATRQNSVASVLSSLGLCRTTSPEAIGAETACVPGNCIQSDMPKPDVVCAVCSGLECVEIRLADAIGARRLWLRPTIARRRTRGVMAIR
ncbi:caspase domain-containing protein [Ganoderma leucocontextum]|nr:caspase domain-containing protein [Ganoderma leucocontextum]